MASLSEFSIKRPVATTMIIISMVGFGLLSIFNLPMALLPNFNIPVVVISTTWVGASPEDVDKLITREIEDIVPNVEGVKKYTSTSSLNSSIVVIEFDYGIDADNKVDEVQREVTKIVNDLPTDANTPIISKASAGAEAVVSVELSGDDLIELRSMAETLVKPRFQRIEGVGAVDIFGGLEREILVELNPEKLDNYDLGVSDVVSVLEQSTVNLPAGNIREGNKEYIVKIEGELETLEQVKNVIIRNSDGKILRLRDVANVSLTTKDVDSYNRVNGKEALALNVSKSDDGNAVEIADKVKLEIEELKSYLPAGTEVNIGFDSSEFIKNSLNTVKNNALTGLVLASIILFVFLKDIRATSVIAMAIPTSIIFTFGLLSVKGISLNLISLMGLSLGVGMLVDNSVVVLDNIFRHMSEHRKPSQEAARDGASEMALPILASTATTVAVFLPIIFKEGLAKEIFHDMSYSIAFSLLASLIIALTFVPMVSSKVLKVEKSLHSEGKVLTFVKKVYLKFLDVTMRHRIKTLIVTVLVFVSSLIIAGKLGGEFMPTRDEGQYTIVAEMPSGVEVGLSDQVAKKLEEIVKNDKYTVKYSISAEAGSVVVNVDTPKKYERDVSIFEIADDMREKIKGIPDVNLNIVYQYGRGPEQGRDIQLNLNSNNFSQLQQFAQIVQDKILQIPGLVDIKSSDEGGNPEAKIVIDRDKAQYYGVRITEIAQMVSYQILGSRDQVTIKTDNDEVDINVQLAEEYRRSTDKLMDTQIKLSSGKYIKLRDVARLEIGEGASEISKEDKIRQITVSANTSGGLDIKTAQKNILAAIQDADIPSGLKYEFGGEGEQMAETMSDLGFAFMLAIFIIYFILAAQFESFALPFIIIGSIPLAVIGVFYGLLITGIKFNVMVMVGIIMLAGIVVNNAIVLIDYINILKARGIERHAAIREAGKTRLRPILMTTLTTVFGMVPLAISNGEGAEMYKGMATAVIFGLSMSTILTLIIIPILYSLVEDGKIRLSIMLKKKKEKSKEVLESKSI